MAWKKVYLIIRVAVKCLLKNIKAESAVDKDKGLSGVKLPKISVPAFDGKVLNLKCFWEQFNVTIHCKTGLNNTEKLMYLQEVLKKVGTHPQYLGCAPCKERQLRRDLPSL